MPQDDPFHLQRFLDAQQDTFAQARAELARGEKRSHWMWFIFPQIAGLGSSSMAQRYAISDLAEARAYLQHAVLGPRLRECTRLVLDSGKPVEQVFPYPDDLKFHSSVTLFARAADKATDGEDGIFSEAIMTLFQGRPDQGTLRRLPSEPATA